jgi:hypothetical protein
VDIDSGPWKDTSSVGEPSCRDSSEAFMVGVVHYLHAEQNRQC